MIQILPERLDQILNNLQNKTVVVLGDIMIDEYLWGKVNRLSPEAPVPIVEIEDESLRFGGGANVAINLKTLGCKPIIIGIVGKDRMGDQFFELLEKFDLSSEGVMRIDDRPTTVKTRIIGDNQHIARVDREKVDYVDDSFLQNIMDEVGHILQNVDAVILQDYNKGILHKDLIKYTIDLANKVDIVSTVDPKFVNFMEYKKATVFKPNVREASQALARVIETEDDVKAAGKTLLETLEVKNVLLTLGSKGMALFEDNGDYSHVHTKTRDVADVSGAGDTVISTMTATMVGGASVKEAASLANYAAGIVCQEVGIFPIEAEQLAREIKNRAD